MSLILIPIKSLKGVLLLSKFGTDKTSSGSNSGEFSLGSFINSNPNTLNFDSSSNLTSHLFSKNSNNLRPLSLIHSGVQSLY